jgi:hypothetical protein
MILLMDIKKRIVLLSLKLVNHQRIYANNISLNQVYMIDYTVIAYKNKYHNKNILILNKNQN